MFGGAVGFGFDLVEVIVDDLADSFADADVVGEERVQALVVPFIDEEMDTF